MSKSIISFLTFVVLVLIIFITSSVFSNLGRVDPLLDGSSYNTVNSTSSASSTTVKTPETSSSKNDSTSSQGNTTININVTSPVVSGISMAEVQKHNLKTNCWTAVGSGVYDLTSFISSHPGGVEKIVSLCGVDGTSAFLDQHGNQKDPNNKLVGLKIGDLAK